MGLPKNPYVLLALGECNMRFTVTSKISKHRSCSLSEKFARTRYGRDLKCSWGDFEFVFPKICSWIIIMNSVRLRTMSKYTGFFFYHKIRFIHCFCLHPSYQWNENCFYLKYLIVEWFTNLMFDENVYQNMRMITLLLLPTNLVFFFCWVESIYVYNLIIVKSFG